MQHFEDFELKNYTSFKIGGKAKNVWFPETIAEFEDLLKTLENPLVLGGMSNVLVSSEGIFQDVILTKKLSNFKTEDTRITAQAGAMGPLVSKAAKQENLSGMEFMCGFPGTIGGIVSMNASAHKQCISDIFISAKLFDKQTKSTLNFSKEDMKFDYRTSVIHSGRYILLEAVFELTKAEQEEIEERMASNQAFRRDRQPNLSKPNCGSVFKNPEGDSAGRLLEDAGAKGLSVGNAHGFEHHANFIINSGGATSTDVSQLMKKMYNMVKEKFGVELKPEVLFVGGMNEAEKEIWQIWQTQK